MAIEQGYNKPTPPTSEDILRDELRVVRRELQAAREDIAHHDKVTEMEPLHYARGKDRTTVPQPSTIDKSVFSGDLELECRALRARIADLDAQLQTARASRLIAPHEEEAIAERSRAFDAMNNEQVRLVRYLRDSFPQSLGTAPTVTAIVIGLLDELKALRAAKAKPGFWVQVFGR